MRQPGAGPLQAPDGPPGVLLGLLPDGSSGLTVRYRTGGAAHARPRLTVTFWRLGAVGLRRVTDVATPGRAGLAKSSPKPRWPQGCDSWSRISPVAGPSIGRCPRRATWFSGIRDAVRAAESPFGAQAMSVSPWVGRRGLRSRR